MPSSIPDSTHAASENGRAPARCIVPGCTRARHRWPSRGGACGMHFQRMRRHGVYELPTLCRVDGCTKPRRAKGVCQMHYRRMRTTGTYELRPKPPGCITSNGYLVLYRQPHHPLRTSGNTVFAHRATLYDRLGPGSHPCHWCGHRVAWEKHHKERDALCVDHLDGNRLNNAPENLVPSCGPCNGTRQTSRMDLTLI